MVEILKPDVKLEAYYGLPEQVVYCQRCVISNQRPASYPEFKHTRNRKAPTMHIDADGVVEFSDNGTCSQPIEVGPIQNCIDFVNPDPCPSF